MPRLEKVGYKGWSNCYRMSNGKMELIITGDVGPRVISLSLAGGENMFVNYPDMMGKTGGDEWRIYGGHRFWVAPEAQPRSYWPDNVPVRVTEEGETVHVVQPVETSNGIEKELEFTFTGETAVRVVHRLRNHNLWAIEVAPWALSVMDVGGTAIVPLPPRDSHERVLLPVNTMTLWAYTDMSDPRWTWGQKYVLLRQDSSLPTPQKVGFMVLDRWAAYANKNTLFLKIFDFRPGKTYPDFGCNVETFTNSEMLELESLGPLDRLEPGATVEHVEHWHLFPNVARPGNDADVETTILPLVKGVLK